MNEIWVALISAIISYFIGSVSMARLVAKKIAPEVDLQKVDLSITGVGTHRLRTVGATNASIKLGSKVGGLIALLDILKGMLPVLICRLLYPTQYYHLIVAVFVTVGHNWSIYYRFTGGSGFSTTYGGYFVVDWIGTLVSVISGMLIGAFVIRDIAVAYMSGPWLMLLWLILIKGDWPYILYGIVVNIILLLALLPDMLDYFKIKGENKMDIVSTMELIPMFGGLVKMMRQRAVDPDKKNEK